jgi:hypothetical protein
MNAVLPEANVTGFKPHIAAVSLPDLHDRHVVAAAIAAKASLIVTWNRKDFPAKELAKHGVKAQNPDAFLTSLYSAAPDATVAATANARKNLRVSRTGPEVFLTELRRQKLRRFVAAMTPHVAKI